MLEFRLALLTLLIGAAYLPGIVSVATQPRWWVMALGVLFVAWSNPIRWHYSGALVVSLLVLWSALGLVWSMTPWDTAEGITAVVLLGAVFLLATQTTDLRWCWEAAALACWLQVPVILLQYAGYEPVYAVVASPTGLMLSKNMLAEFAFAAGVGVLFTQRPWLVLGPLVCVVIPWTVYPATELVLAGGVALTTYVASRYTKWWLLPAVAVLAAAVMLGFLSKVPSFNARLGIWEAASYWGWIYPFGWGLNSFADTAAETEYVHNDFIQLFFELGFPGLVIAGVLFWRAFSAPEGVEAKCVLAAILACSVLWWPLRCPATAFMVALCAGNLWGRHRSVDYFGFRRRTHGSVRLQDRYADLSSDTVRAARAGGEVVPARPQHALVGREVSEHV